MVKQSCIICNSDMKQFLADFSKSMVRKWGKLRDVTWEGAGDYYWGTGDYIPSLIWTSK